MHAVSPVRKPFPPQAGAVWMIQHCAPHTGAVPGVPGEQGGGSTGARP